MAKRPVGKKLAAKAAGKAAAKDAKKPKAEKAETKKAKAEDTQSQAPDELDPDTGRADSSETSTCGGHCSAKRS